MRKSANGQSLIKPKPQVKPAAAVVPVTQPPSPPLQNHLAHSLGLKLQ
jgi:hypothetical protein